MTDRVNALCLVLDHDMRTDDVEYLINLCSQLKGVIRVEPNVVDIADVVAKARVGMQMKQKIYAALKTVDT